MSAARSIRVRVRLGPLDGLDASRALALRLTEAGHNNIVILRQEPTVLNLSPVSPRFSHPLAWLSVSLMMPLTRLRLRFRSRLRLGLAGRCAVAALVLLGAGVGAGLGAGLGAGAAQAQETGSTAAEQAAQSTGPVLSTNARAAVLLELETETVLYAKNPRPPVSPPASLSKLATVYATFRALEKEGYSGDDTFSVSEKAWRTGGSKMFVEVGKRVRIDDLLRGVIVSSGNDASIVLAEGLGGGRSRVRAGPQPTQCRDRTAQLPLRQRHRPAAPLAPDERGRCRPPQRALD